MRRLPIDSSLRSLTGRSVRRRLVGVARRIEPEGKLKCVGYMFVPVMSSTAASSAAGNGGGVIAPPPPLPATAAAVAPHSCVHRNQGPCLDPGPAVRARVGPCTGPGMYRNVLLIKFHARTNPPVHHLASSGVCTGMKQVCTSPANYGHKAIRAACQGAITKKVNQDSRKCVKAYT